MDLEAIKRATWTLHTKAERSGVIADIVAGRAGRLAVALLLRNLLPVYQVLDGSRFCAPGLARAAAIEADLRVLSPDAEVPLLPEGADYAGTICRAAESGGGELIAHAYVRYLGDLNGGLIMKRRLVACLGDLGRQLRFHDYPELADVGGFACAYRLELERALGMADSEAAGREAVVAFECNIALSAAVKAACLLGPAD